MFGFSKKENIVYKSLLLPSDVADEDARIEDTAPALSTKFHFLILIICFVCTFVNAILTFAPSVNPQHHSTLSSMSKKDLHRLRRPSQYIGFDEIARPSPPVPRNFTNFPFLLTQIDQENAARVFDDDPMRYMSHVGTISPEDRRVKLTNTISTIVQFRAVDYGMESCELHLVLPHNATSMFRTEDYLTLSLFRLNATVPLDPKHLSYVTRPQLVSKIAKVQVYPGHGLHWNQKFACATEEVLTFELACGNDRNCSVEWWQNKETSNPVPAIYVIQHSTL